MRHPDASSTHGAIHDDGRFDRYVVAGLILRFGWALAALAFMLSIWLLRSLLI
jgi:hypothetical protein